MHSEFELVSAQQAGFEQQAGFSMLVLVNNKLQQTIFQGEQL